MEPFTVPGRAVLDGRLTALDTDGVLTRAREFRDGILTAAGHHFTGAADAVMHVRLAYEWMTAEVDDDTAYAVEDLLPAILGALVDDDTIRTEALTLLPVALAQSAALPYEDDEEG